MDLGEFEGVPLDEVPHADYPHAPGYLRDCARCESECFCSHLPGHEECVFCVSLREEWESEW